MDPALRRPGGLHGRYLVVERVAKGFNRDGSAPQNQALRALLAVGTCLVVTVTRVFFRAESFDGALQILNAMAGLAPIQLHDRFRAATVLSVVFTMLIAQGALRGADLERAAARRRASDGGRAAVVLVGSSRIQLAISPEERVAATGWL